MGKKLALGLLFSILCSGVGLNGVIAAVKEQAITFNNEGHSHDGEVGGGKQISGSRVLYSPTGGLTALNLRGAVNQLEANKLSVNPLASSVVFTPAGTIAATNVQEAVEEVASDSIPLTQKGIANGVATLGAEGTIPVVQISKVVITDVYTCVDEACQIALTAEEGDFCVRTDAPPTSWIHNGGVAGTMADWWEVEAVGLVASVNGQVGVVTGMEETGNRQTTITDSDTKYGTSGAVFDHHSTTLSLAPAHSSTTGQTTDDHHDDMSDTYNITPATVTTTGNIKINSDSMIDRLLFGITGDTSFYRGGVNSVWTDGSLVVVGALDTRSNVYFRTDSGKIYFGSTGQTNLYRTQANVLKTDGTFEVAGDASNYTHATTTKYIIVNSTQAIFPSTSGATCNGSGTNNQHCVEISPSSGDGAWYYASLSFDIPIGVTITNIDIQGRRNESAANLSGTLYRRSYNSPTVSNLGSCSFTSIGANVTCSFSLSHVIENNYGYYIYVAVEENTTNKISFMTAKVTYTSSNLSQVR